LFSLDVGILRGECDQPMKPYACLIGLCLSGALAVAQNPAPATVNASHVSHGRFKDVLVYTPPKPINFVLLLSGDEGMNANTQSVARQLAEHGAMVAAIDLPGFKAALQADGGNCVFPDGDLENLSHFVQAYFHNSTYLAPMLVGMAAGGTLAYAALAQAPRDTFAAALSVGFCANFDLQKPLCKGSGLEFSRLANNYVQFSPIKNLGNPWVVIQSVTDASCPAAPTRDFVAKVHGAGIATVQTLSAPVINAALASLANSSSSARVPPPPAALGALPVIEVAPQSGVPPADSFAIIMSGDGGWAGLDQDIAAALSARGMPVVGLDSLRYYWTARTPEGLAADTDRMIRYYMARFNKSRVLLVGYSQGADVLPFAVNRLPAATRAHVALTAILGMSEHALFEFHVSSWISDDNSGPATLPEVDRITGMPVLCIYGEDEKDSLCPKLDAKKNIVVKVKGGHHFDGNYAGLAQEIIAAAAPPHP
jgi:type IV secretory pathway VirJ component